MRSEHGAEWGADIAEVRLQSYLAQYFPTILQASLEGRPIVAPVMTLGDDEEYFVADFILHLDRRDLDGFRILETLMKGAILANALVYPPEHRLTEPFSKTEIYVDTRILLRALGFCGPTLGRAPQELLSLLQKQQAHLACFEHTLHEIRGVLEFVVHALRDRRYLLYSSGDVLEHFVVSGASASDVDLEIGRLEHRLRDLGVEIRGKPPFDDVAYSVDEGRFKEVLRSEVGYSSEDALEHDLQCLTGVWRLRRGRNPSKLEASHALFVTTNAALVKASAMCFRENEEGRRLNVPCAMLDHVLTTLAWVKTPSKAPDLPRAQLVATAYAAVNPSDALWRRYQNEVGKLEKAGAISEDDSYRLRFSTAARSELMRQSRGRVDSVDEGTVRDILEQVKAREQGQLRRTIGALTIEKDALQRKLEAEEIARREQDEAREVGVRRRSEHLDALASKSGRIVGRALLVMLFLVIGVGVWRTLPDGVVRFEFTWLDAIAPVCLLAIGAFTFMNLCFGTTVRSVVAIVEKGIARKVRSLLARVDAPPKR